MYTYKKIYAYSSPSNAPLPAFTNIGRHWPGSFLGENVTVF